jgi:hypothetical protein
MLQRPEYCYRRFVASFRRTRSANGCTLLDAIWSAERDRIVTTAADPDVARKGDP